ncbi:MAG: YdeI family protein [Vicinamibacterales bacterium]
MSKPEPTHFADVKAFRKWLAANHKKQTELWVGFYKVGSGIPTVSYKEAVDEALCFGWIDGVRNAVDETRYMNRFTPRTKTSTWSAVNIKRFAELEAEGRVTKAGRAAFEARRDDRSGIYSYEQRQRGLTPAYEARLRKDRKAWMFFERQPPSYRKIAGHWVVSAKQEATRERRFAELVRDCREGLRIKLLRR